MIKRKSWIKRSNKPIARRKRLRVAGHSSATELKKEIQGLIRTLAIARDGGCVLRHYPEAGTCGGYRKDGQLILQAEHLVTRSNSATFGHMRNIICICRNHHIFFKPKNSLRYWDIIRKHVGEDTWKWIKDVEEEYSRHKAVKTDWKLVKMILEQEVKKLST